MVYWGAVAGGVAQGYLEGQKQNIANQKAARDQAEFDAQKNLAAASSQNLQSYLAKVSKLGQPDTPDGTPPPPPDGGPLAPPPTADAGAAPPPTAPPAANAPPSPATALPVAAQTAAVNAGVTPTPAPAPAAQAIAPTAPKPLNPLDYHTPKSQYYGDMAKAYAKVPTPEAQQQAAQYANMAAEEKVEGAFSVLGRASLTGPQAFAGVAKDMLGANLTITPMNQGGKQLVGQDGHPVYQISMNGAAPVNSSLPSFAAQYYAQARSNPADAAALITGQASKDANLAISHAEALKSIAQTGNINQNTARTKALTPVEVAEGKARADLTTQQANLANADTFLVPAQAQEALARVGQIQTGTDLMKNGFKPVINGVTGDVMMVNDADPSKNLTALDPRRDGMSGFVKSDYISQIPTMQAQAAAASKASGKVIGIGIVNGGIPGFKGANGQAYSTAQEAVQSYGQALPVRGRAPSAKPTPIGDASGVPASANPPTPNWGTPSAAMPTPNWGDRPPALPTR